MATGKVFKDSINIYQDQAKVLFDYYKKAAEQIVKEEEESEQRTRDLLDFEKKFVSQKKTSFVLFIVFAAIFVFFSVIAIIRGVTHNGIGLFAFVATVFFIAFIVNIVVFFRSKKSLEENSKLQEEEKTKFENIRRNYKVSKIGVAYVPVATQVPFGQKSFLIDHTNSVNNTNFSLSKLNNPKDLSESVEELQKCINTVPFLEKNENTEEIDSSDYSTSIQNIKLHDYSGQIDRNVRNISYLLNDSENLSVGLPVVNPKSKLSETLDEYTTTDTNNKKVVQVFNIDDFDSKIKKFESLNVMKDQIDLDENEEITEYFKKLMGKLATSIQTVSKMKVSSTSKLVNYCSGIFANVLKASFNQYSPQLEAEAIERIRSTSFDYQDEVNSYIPFELKASSRVRYDLMSGAWIAEDSSRTSMPFGMNQIDEEIFMPIIKNLMEENRVERLKIYNNIKDQKMSYLNKWHQDVEDFYGRNRQEANELIQKMHETFSDFSSAYQTYNALEETQNSMKTNGNTGESAIVNKKDNKAEIIASFEVQANQYNSKQEEFSEFMDRIKDDIDDCAAKFGHIEYYEASLRDGESQKVAKGLEEAKALDERRKPLVAVSGYFASNANILPEPNTSPELMNDFTLNLEKNVEESLNYLNTTFSQETAQSEEDDGVKEEESAGEETSEVSESEIKEEENIEKENVSLENDSTQKVEETEGEDNTSEEETEAEESVSSEDDTVEEDYETGSEEEPSDDDKEEE